MFRPGLLAVSNNCHSPSVVIHHQLSLTVSCHSPSAVTHHQLSVTTNCHSPSAVTLHQLSLTVSCHSPSAVTHQLDAVRAPLGPKTSWRFDWVYSARHEFPLGERVSDQLVFLYDVVHSCTGAFVLQFVMSFREWITVN